MSRLNSAPFESRLHPAIPIPAPSVYVPPKPTVYEPPKDSGKPSSFPPMAICCDGLIPAVPR